MGSFGIIIHSAVLSCKKIIGVIGLMWLSISHSNSQNGTLKKDTIEINRQLRKATYFIQTDNDSALYYTLQVLNLSQAANYRKGILDASNILGFIYTQKQNWITPIEREKLARLFAASLIDNKRLSDILLNTAEDYYQYNEKKRASETLKFAFQIANYENNKKGAVKALMRRAEILSELHDGVQSQNDYAQSLQLSLQLNDSSLISTVYNSRGKVSFDHGNYQQSINDLNFSLKYCQHPKNPNTLYCYLVLAQNYIKLNQLDKAHNYIVLTEQNKQIDTVLQVKSLYTWVLADYYEKVDQTKAIHYYKTYSHLKDSLNTINHIRYVNALRDAFNSQKNEKQLESISEEVEIERIKRRTFLIVALIVGVMVVFSIIGIRKRNRILKRENEISRERIRMDQEHLKNIQERNLIEEEKAENRKQLELIEKEKLRQNLERAEIERRELAIELDEKHRVLLTNTMQNEQYNDFLNEIQEELKEMANISEKRLWNKTLTQLANNIQSKLTQADDWEKIKVYFEKVHPEFFAKLKTDFPDLTINELKFCVYTKMKMNGKEISRVLNINPSSVQVSRYRLKRKMNLPEEVNFTDFILRNY